MPLKHWDSASMAASWKDTFAFLAVPILAGQPHVYRDEYDLQHLAGGLLQDAEIPPRHEVRLARGAYIDFVSRGVGA